MKNFELTEEIKTKWAQIVESQAVTEEDRSRLPDVTDVAEIRDARTKKNLTIMLETSERVLTEEANTSAVANWDPILISLIRRTQPSLTMSGMLGIQPMTGPTGLIFVMRSHYVNPTTGVRTETFNQLPADPTKSGTVGGVGMSTVDGENLGRNMAVDGTSTTNPTPVYWTAPWQEMDFTIEKSTVTAKTRALKARYTRELEQDLRAIHGLDAEAELSAILATEITAELDREFLALMLAQAVDAGDFDLDTDTDGRWMVEKYKALVVKIEREANKIARGTRRGKGNFIITTADVAGALNMAGKIDTQTVFGSFEPNPVGMAYVGVMAGTYRVYIDQYAAVNYVLVGYKGPNIYDAGIFYSPYVPLEYMKAQGPEDFQPRIGFKTRYGISINPFAQYDGTAIGVGNGNQYFRKFTITNL